jgi:type II secretory pathway pseudopilin PulG
LQCVSTIHITLNFLKFSNIFSNIKSRKGETLVEVLIAILVLLVGALSVLRYLAWADVANQLTKERVVATNLAREGLEAVRSIRDTNWLRFAGERRICWNNLNISTCIDNNSDGVPDDVIEHQNRYLAEFSTNNFRWRLSPSGVGALDIDDSEVSADDEIYRIHRESNGLYNQSGTGDDTIYFREIYIEYLAGDQSLASGEDANIMRITSNVQWYDRGKTSDVTLTTILTDYLGRKNHN